MSYIKLKKTEVLEKQETKYQNIHVFKERTKRPDINFLEQIGYPHLAERGVYPEGAFLNKVADYLKRNTGRKVSVGATSSKAPNWAILEKKSKWHPLGTNIAGSEHNQKTLETTIYTNDEEVIAAVNKNASNYMKALEATYHQKPAPVRVIMK